MSQEHVPECPKGRHDRHGECICDLLRACRAAARAPRREKKKDEDAGS